jgi:transcriptional regulator with XRE-family HTH domain
LALISGVPSRTVADFELGNTAPRRATTERIAAALEAAGVEFIPENGGGAGVRLRERS